MKMSKFWEDYPDIAEELGNIKNIIKNNIKSSEKEFDEAISPLVEAGGKNAKTCLFDIGSKIRRI